MMFEHLLVSIIIGLIVYKIVKIEGLSGLQTVILFGIGGILADIIDKPLYLVFGYGRSIMHSIIIVSLLFIVIFYLTRKNQLWRNILFIMFSMVILHQIMDSMWLTQGVWLFPLLGCPSEFWCNGPVTVSASISYLFALASNVLDLREGTLMVGCMSIMTVFYRIENGRYPLQALDENIQDDSKSISFIKDHVLRP